MTQEYVTAFKTKDLPQLGTLFEATARIHTMGIKQTALAQYSKDMASVCGPNTPYIAPDILADVWPLSTPPHCRLIVLISQAHVVASNNAMSVFAKAPKLHSPVLEDAMRIELEDAIAHK